MGAEARIKELGITLPSPAKPMGNYVPGVRVGNLLFLSGHGPIRVEGQPLTRGKVGRDTINGTATLSGPRIQAQLEWIAARGPRTAAAGSVGPFYAARSQAGGAIR